jgi:hypothetical protein
MLVPALLGYAPLAVVELLWVTISLLVKAVVIKEWMMSGSKADLGSDMMVR